MAWRERLLDATFRGVAFHVDSHDYAGGRRTLVHEFPGRDQPFVEDLGRRARSFTIEAYVLGPDYDAARDALRDALEQPEPAWLAHPYLGDVFVRAAQVSLRESTREGGLARFTITFQESGSLRAVIAPATQEQVAAAAEATLAEAIAAFGRAFDVLGMPADYVAELQGDLGELMNAVEGVVSGATGAAAALIRAPANMAASIAGSINSVRTALGEPTRAFQLYAGMFDASPGRPSLAATPGRRQQAASQAALVALVRQVALSEAAGALAGTDFGSATEAQAMRDSLLNGIDAASGDADGAALQALSDLRAAAARDVAARGAGLPLVVSYTPPATLPAVVVAHVLYGDATREADIVSRNSIRHPGFVPAGEPLEVLTDA